MESKEKTSFQVLGNHFDDVESEFVSHITLNTSAGTQRPYYPQISVIKNYSDKIIMGIKTAQSIILVHFKKNEFEEYKKVSIDDPRMEKQILTYFTFQKPSFSNQNPPYIIAGYRSGLLAYIDCFKQRVLSVHNFDEKTNSCPKSQMVTLITPIHGNNSNEVLVLFNDSTILRYTTDIQSESQAFLEKMRKFESKISFTQSKNRFRYKEKKSKQGFMLGASLFEATPEFSHFYIINQTSSDQNPVSFFKFNQRTITDLVIKNHQGFKNSILSQSKSKDPTIMALTSYDGYLIIYDYYKMDPLFSYKSTFGGFNSITFSENCDWVALSGRDDCSILINLITHRKIKLEGHRSFVSKTIFHDISKFKTTNEEESKSSKTEYMRVITGSMDSSLGFWEFEKKNTTSDKDLNSKLPVRLFEKNSTIEVIEPVYLEKTKDAIGWIEFVEDFMVQCGYDGVVSTYLIKDVRKKKKTLKDISPLSTSLSSPLDHEGQVLNMVTPMRRPSEGFFESSSSETKPIMRDIKTSHGRVDKNNKQEQEQQNEENPDN